MIFSFLLGLREVEGAWTPIKVDIVRDLCPWEGFVWPWPHSRRLRTMQEDWILSSL